MASSSSSAVTSISLPSLPLVATGKVRELYRISDSTLLMAVTDRISAFDVVLDTGIPDKGAILCQISAHWFRVLSDKVPELKHHLVSLQPPASPEVITRDEASVLRGRCLQVRSLKIFPIEVIVRGYITGSAWAEYQKTGTVHGLPQPEGLKCCSRFPGGPIYTPSTKAPAGESDVNISPAEARAIVGSTYADRIESLALRLYSAAHEYALERGIILADTKFEFGLDEDTGDIVLADEVLTPDSSRFWPAPVREGEEQPSFDKQFVRKYLIDNGLKGKEGVSLPDDVVRETTSKYREVFERLTGRSLDQALAALDS
ncbi:Phosphoribosylaminoimidazole-succinocarboxamide synthase-like protein [Hapsidospora chrysogenum ATCC 11550]|uniref:Phosphoribosylaminoimidazole-succinocarboxamide synthase n=1 Tax=Hapsidospora chrysogenum (strain ATCC 11550 / CBS 779.69 / DSM 880 / IAM 14645 / JCM 23072 / IMI 49137) TaxID=857340 RepID=A0A086T922_HAPC1|nr:Phosphoribosylaminoimidazole-succinocarboxamide synthase-like protein [Hapsidospora chrysogenum ATCC 11550]